MTELLADRPPFSPLRNVLLCDERPGVRRAIVEHATGLPSETEITCVADGFGLVDAYSAHRPDLVLVGIRSGRPGGDEAAYLLLGLHPAALVVVYGSHQDVQPMAAAVSRGARGLMLWDPVPTNGRSNGFTSDRARAPGATGKAVTTLTQREMQVLHGMSSGRSNNEIGRELYLSEDTIKTHARRLFVKLGARDRAQAVFLGLRQGLLA